MKIGVSGARGRLGKMVMDTLARHDGIEPVALGASRTGLDAVINTAPLDHAALHRSALTSGCHVVDVTIDRSLIREMLALGAVAQRHDRCLMVMAGLSPGLTGLLAREMLAEATGAGHVQVSLLQSGAGTAGKQGTREMMDLLTRPGCAFEPRPYPRRGGAPPTVRRLFDLDGPELEFLDGRERMRLATGFDSRAVNGGIRVLAHVRRAAPPVYGRLRDIVAAGKARGQEAPVEVVELGAVALAPDGRTLAQRLIRFASDYGATAAVACAAATLVVRGRVRGGAGHLSDFVSLGDVLNHPIVRAQILAS